MKKKAANLIIPALFCFAIMAESFAPSRICAPSGGFLAQKDSVDTFALLLHEGDSLRKAYCFGASAESFDEAAQTAPDSLSRLRAEEEAMLSRNGLSMLSYCSKPTVVARQRFSLEDFFLYYPMPDRSWRAVPNVLDSIAPSALQKATFVQGNETTIYYSAADADGARNIYRTEFADTIWTVPALAAERITSSGNEIFPILGNDGKALYFASDGLYGMGGYDLYVSLWDDTINDWGTPSNLGFPFSSPFDDFLCINTSDGKHTIFASNRDCSKDSVYVYVLEYDSLPMHSLVEDESDDIRTLAALHPAADASRVDNEVLSSPLDDAGSGVLREYVDKVLQIKQIRDSIRIKVSRADAARDLYASADEAGRQAMAEKLISYEESIVSLEEALNTANRELQKLEMDMILSGKTLDFDKVQALADKEVKGADQGYAFSARSLGADLQMKIEQPEPEFDYSFMILPEGRFAEDNNLPDGIVYQIQLFSKSRQAEVKDLKGLSPVFWRKSGTAKYTYFAGLFRTYNDALSNLNKVKKAGFKTAFIVAFRNGESVTVATARKQEKPAK